MSADAQEFTIDGRRFVTTSKLWTMLKGLQDKDVPKERVLVDVLLALCMDQIFLLQGTLALAQAKELPEVPRGATIGLGLGNRMKLPFRAGAVIDFDRDDVWGPGCSFVPQKYIEQCFPECSAWS